MTLSHIFKASAALALAVLASLSAAQPVTHLGERPIKREEIAVLVGRLFAIADANKDSTLTKAELRFFREGLDTRDHAAFDEMAAQSFDNADIDGDGEIARWEADQRSAQLFDMIDVDQNGIASVEEQSVAAALTNLEGGDLQNLFGKFSPQSFEQDR